VQAFIDPTNLNGNFIVDPSWVHDVREGVNGKPGLSQICRQNNVRLMIAAGGGGAPRFIPDDESQIQPIVDRLLYYVVQYGYAGIDIDEENTVPLASYVKFMQVLATTFKSAGPYNVSCAIGPLSCCYETRGVCQLTNNGVGKSIDWAFLMLYDGLVNGAGFDGSQSGQTIWQADDGQRYCGVQPIDPNQHGIVGNVGVGACQFIDFALYLNWTDNLIMGLPMYTYSSPHAWFELLENSAYKQIGHDPVTLLTQYTGGLWIPSPDDVTQRTQRVIDPKQSVLGITLDNSGWQSKILTCSRQGLHAGETILGVGFWQIGHEDALHHELSSAARQAINAVNEEYPDD